MRRLQVKMAAGNASIALNRDIFCNLQGWSRGVLLGDGLNRNGAELPQASVAVNVRVMT